MAFAVFFMHEPPRGQYEKEDVLGEVIEDENPAQPSMEAAFARAEEDRDRPHVDRGLRRARLRRVRARQPPGAVPERHAARHEHACTAASSSACRAGPPCRSCYPVGRYFDRTYRKNPAKALVLVGLLILPSALFTPLQVSTHSAVWFVIWGIPQAVLTACAFAMVTPVLQAVCPYRLRGLGVAMGVMYIVFIGGFGGAHPRRLLHERVRRARPPSSCSSSRRASSAASC